MGMTLEDIYYLIMIIVPLCAVAYRIGYEHGKCVRK